MKTVQEILKENQAVQRAYETERDRTKIETCIKNYLDLLNQAPESPEIVFQLATAYLQLGWYGAGISLIKRSLAHWPDAPDLWSNLGCCYRSLFRIPEAKDAFLKALSLDERPEILSNLAACFVNEGSPEGGIQYATRALELERRHPKAAWNLALLSLELESWAQGFALYDAGLDCAERLKRDYGSVPYWNGESGQTVVVHDEQGIGDRIMAAQLLEFFRDRITIILECHPRLVDSYRRSFPWIEHIYGTVKDEFISWPLEHQIDAKAPILSLAKHVWGSGIFPRKPYLKAKSVDVVKGRIGFAWAGGAPRTNTAYRSLKLSQFKPLIESGGEWVSFQYNDWAQDKIERFNAETGLNVRHFGDTPNYDDTLSELATCELVITACNSVAHTCGAAGIPCWVLVPQKRAWRYTSGESSPFYSDAFVQIHQRGTWDDTIEQVKERLDARCDHRSRSVAA